MRIVELHPIFQYPVWFNKNLTHQLKCLHTLRRLCRCSPSPYHSSKLQRAEARFQQDATEAKSIYEASLINNFVSSGNPSIYRYINSVTKTKRIPSTVYLDEIVVNNDECKAKLFNQYFFSVFTSTPCKHSNHVEDSSICADSLSSLVFTEAEVYNAFMYLDPNKATGIDGIGPKILKYCAMSLFRPLCHLFNLSLSSGTIPSEWKIHLITPVYKPADRSCINNYRPISLLCNISKVLESLIHDKIIPHVSTLISPYQFGFLVGQLFNNCYCFFIIFLMLFHVDIKLIPFIWIYVKHLTVYLMASCLVNWRNLVFLVICGTGFIVTLQIVCSVSTLTMQYLIYCLLFLVCPKGVSLAWCFL